MVKARIRRRERGAIRRLRRAKKANESPMRSSLRSSTMSRPCARARDAEDLLPDFGEVWRLRQVFLPRDILASNSTYIAKHFGVEASTVRQSGPIGDVITKFFC